MDTLTGGGASPAGSFAPPGAKATPREWDQLSQLFEKFRSDPDTIAKDPNLRKRLEIPSVGENQPAVDPAMMNALQHIIKLLPKRPPEEEFPTPRRRSYRWSAERI